MMSNPPSTTVPAHALRSMYNAVAAWLERLVGHDALALVARLSIGAIFLQSGRTKVDGLLSVSENAVALFADEYRLPLVSPVLAAHAATYAEHLLPVLLIAGLFTRFAALGLLAMVAVIQVFVYPDAWPTHLSWAGLLAYLAARGAGSWSLDRLVGLK